MRPAALAIAVAGFGIASLLVTAGGHRLAALDVPTVDAIDEDEAVDEASPPPEADSTFGIEQSDPQPQGAEPAESRAVAPGEVAPPMVEQGGLLREAPRAPLSELSLALPPKPKKTDEWDGTALFQPVASAAGLIEAKGFNVAISGVIPVEADKSCSFEGSDWNCGVRARTAFRGLLRSRAVICDVPPEAGRVVVAKCRIGKQDIGGWLVANGWATAKEGGPYSELGEKARAAKKGIFGPPPERISMTLSPGSTELPSVEPSPAADAPAQ